jgi:hypothetical protein
MAITAVTKERKMPTMAMMLESIRDIVFSAIDHARRDFGRLSGKLEFRSS